MSVLYMFDTDICAFVLRRSSEVLLQRIQTVPMLQQVISVVSYAELLYGVQLSSKKKTNQAALDTLVRHLAVLDWTQEAAKHYAEIRADLKKKGAMAGANDLMISAHARSVGAVVVTNNTKNFKRIKGLKIENWMFG
jgi:tRNA(fMet)-specific endonuclease VapC